MTRYRVVAPLVSGVPTAEAAAEFAKRYPQARRGPAVTTIDFTAGQLLPADVPQDHLDHLLAHGMIAEEPE